MIYHILRLRWSPDAPEADVSAALAQIRRFAEIEGVEGVVVGPNINGNYDTGVIVMIRDIEAYKVYFAHPIHKRSDELAPPLMDEMMTFDIADDDDPAIAEEIMTTRSSLPRDLDRPLPFEIHGDTITRR